MALFKSGGVAIALFPKASFADDTGLDVADVEHGAFSRFSLAHNVAGEGQVDSVLAEAAQAGARMVKEAQEIFFGRRVFFADPEGYLGEVAWNPSFPMAPDGSIESGRGGTRGTPCADAEVPGTGPLRKSRNDVWDAWREQEWPRRPPGWGASFARGRRWARGSVGSSDDRHAEPTTIVTTGRRGSAVG